MVAGGLDRYKLVVVPRASHAPDDVVVAISTSGNSPNILKAIDSARAAGAYIVGWGGKDGGKLRDVCDLALIVPSDDTPRIQEGHITIGHIIKFGIIAYI